MADQSLKDKTVKGTFWSAADAFLGQGVSFVVGVILARLLTPEEYGLIGVVLIFTTVLTGVMDSGFSNALIRKKDTTDFDYNTMFITNMTMSVLLFVILWFCSPLIAVFFNRPELLEITRVMGLILIFQALSITQNTILTKRIDFKTKTKASLISSVSSGVIGICMAFMGYGVWALVGQKLSHVLIGSVFLWIYNRWMPSFSFSKESFHYMWGFGWKLMLSGILNNVWNQLYQVVVGKFYSPATLGQYSRSKEYASIFSSNFTSIIQRVTFPVLSEMQDDKSRMVTAYRRVIRTTMFITAISMFFLGAISEPLLYCLIGPKWHEAATYLPIICISMSLYPLHAINLNMLQVQGRSDIFLYLEIIKKIISILPICLGIFVNIYWMLIGSVLTGVISFFLNSYFTGRSLNYNSLMQLKDVAPSYGVALIIGLSAYILKYLPVSNWIILPMQISIGIMVFLAMHKLTSLTEYREMRELIQPVVKKFRIKH